MSEFAVFILTHGRPDRVLTYSSLKKHNYTGPIFLLVDTADKTKEEYCKRFKDQVILFDKQEISPTFDHLDNFNEMRAIVYARNANFKIAEEMGIKYFIQLDDDYTNWNYHFNSKLEHISSKNIRNLDRIFEVILEFYKNAQIDAISLAQGADYIGATYNKDKPKLLRKCMNSWFLSTERKLEFKGTLNEDVNTYVGLGAIGKIIFTTTHVSLQQVPTQQAAGGMTEVYQDSGTYRKSFYTVMLQPSSVKVKALNTTNTRIHHFVKWRYTVPKILREKYKRKNG